MGMIKYKNLYQRIYSAHQLLVLLFFSYWLQISATKETSSCSVCATLSETTSLVWSPGADLRTRSGR